MQMVRDVFRLPGVRRLEFGWGLATTGELAGMVALVAYAYGAGGAVLAAVYVASRTLAGMFVALGVAGCAGRIPRDALLRRLTGLRAVLLALAAVTAATGGPPAAVIMLAIAGSSLSGTYRPLQVALLPWLVRTPAELAAANAAAAMLENSGSLAGPVLAGALLAAGPVWVPVAAAAGCLGLATLSLRRLAVPDQPGRAGREVRDAVAGLADLARVAPPAGVAVLAFAQTFVRGALAVLIAVFAVKTLSLGTSAIGWLNAAMGAGGLIGSVVAAAVVRVNRLGRAFTGGLLLWGLPLAVLALRPASAVAFGALVLVGLGNAVEDVGGFTLVARLIGARSVGRVLFAKEFLAQAGLSAGSLAAPLLLRMLGIRGALALLGGGLAVLAAAHARRFARLDRAMPPPQEVGLLRGLAMFEPLPLAVIEVLAASLRPCEFPPGAAVVREGEPGDEFHLIVSGSAEVSVRGAARPPLASGACFGEIALLRGIPRTATVVAGQPMRTLALDREAFLAAVASNPTTGAIADALVNRRLTADRARVAP